MSYAVPFNRPSLVGTEYEYMSQALANGHISGDGAFTRRCNAMLEKTLGVQRALLTTSCTHALEMSAMLLDGKPGDQVIIPSFTFVSTVNAFVLRGMQPVFADIRPDTLNLDESALEQLITPRTRAIVVVHYAGVSCDMDRIMSIAARRQLMVIEDNAQGLFGRYRGRNLGSFGALATLSFHETKNVTCGEGGALLVNQEDLVERAEVIREKGTNRAQFFRGQVDKYTWVDLGSSYLPSDLLAAFLFAQLEAAGTIQEKRRRVWTTYQNRLSDWAASSGVRLPIIPPECEQPFHMFYLLLPSLEQRQQLIAHLRSQGILGVFHYVPLHTSPMGLRYGGKPGDCPVTEDVSDRLIRLPFYTSLSERDQSLVIDAVTSFRVSDIAPQRSAASG